MGAARGLLAIVLICALSALSARGDEKLSGDLAKAIRAGDLDAVKEAVDKGADINALDERKMPPIGAAALLGKVDIVNYLAEKGADVNKNDGYGFTPLMCAAQRGQAGAVRALLKHGADPALKGGNGADAMTYARPNGPADPLFDQKTSVQKIINDAIIAKLDGHTPEAKNPVAPPAPPVPNANPPQANPQGNAGGIGGIGGLINNQAAVPQFNIEQSPLVNKNADGTLGVAEKDGKPIDGVKLSVHDWNEGSPSICVAPDGSIHAIFREESRATSQLGIYHRASSDGGKTWTESKNLSEDLTEATSGYCQVIADRQNRVYAVWRAGQGAAVEPGTLGHSNLWFRVLQNGAWSKAKLVHPAMSEKFPRNDGSLSWYVALDAAGKVNVVWVTHPDKWHNELVNIKTYPPGYREGYGTVGDGLVFQTTLDGANAAPPHEAMMTPLTGRKGDVAHPPTCDSLETINGFIDASGQPLLIGRVTNPTVAAQKTIYRYQIFERGKPGAFLEVPELTYHASQNPPKLLIDAQGKRHLLTIWPKGEHASVRDFLIGTDQEPTIVYQATGARGTLNGAQAYQGPGGRMAVCIQTSDGSVQGEGDLVVSTSTGGGKWSTPINVTDNAQRKSWSSRQTGIVSNIAIARNFVPGPAAAAFDKDGHLLLLMIQNDRGAFSNQQGVVTLVGGSSTPMLYFLRI